MLDFWIPFWQLHHHRIRAWSTMKISKLADFWFEFDFFLSIRESVFFDLLDLSSELRIFFLISVDDIYIFIISSAFKHLFLHVNIFIFKLFVIDHDFIIPDFQLFQLCLIFSFLISEFSLQLIIVGLNGFSYLILFFAVFFGPFLNNTRVNLFFLKLLL